MDKVYQWKVTFFLPQINVTVITYALIHVFSVFLLLGFIIYMSHSTIFIPFFFVIFFLPQINVTVITYALI